MDVAMRFCRYILILALAAMALYSCSTGECLENQSAIPRAGFYSSSTKKQVSLDSVSIYAVGVPGDSMMVRVGRGVSQVYMPLDMTSDVTRYVLHYDVKELSDERLNDTLTIRYSRVPYFESSECGAMYYYDVFGYGMTTHLVDSVSIITDRFTNVDIETIRIYMRTSE